MSKTSEPVSLDEQQVPLPPGMEKFLGSLRGDRQRLMRDDAFGKDVAQLRSFIGMYVYPRLDAMFRLMAGLGLESYQLAASNTNEVRRLHAFVVDELNELGADLPGGPVPGVSPDILDEFQERFYALGTALQEEAPGNKRLEDAFNACAEAISAIIGDLMGDYDDHDDDRDDDGDDDGDDVEDREGERGAEDVGDDDASGSGEKSDAAEEGEPPSKSTPKKKAEVEK